MWQHSFHLRNPDLFPRTEIGDGISVPMINDKDRENNKADIHVQFKRIETLFVLGTSRHIPIWAWESFWILQEHLRRDKTLEGYKGSSLLAILVWWFGEYDGKTFFESLGWKTNPRDVMIGKILFQLIRWSIHEKGNHNLISKITHLNTENNTGLIIQELILRYETERNLEYIGLIEDIILLASEKALESLILHEWKTHSILDLVRIYNDQEKGSDDTSALGHYTEIIRILESHWVLTVEQILQKNDIKQNLPLHEIPGIQFPFWIKQIDPIKSTINTRE